MDPIVEYQYIKFVKQITHTKTDVYICRNVASGDSPVDTLGVVKWYGAWRQYCYFPEPGTVFSKGCLNDISDFLDKLMKERK